MLDIGWSEILLIAMVAIVVIGPKELPTALRSVGGMLTRLRRMAGEFQGQFQQAMREAELGDVQKNLAEIRNTVSVMKGGFNPTDLVRKEMTGTLMAPEAKPALMAPEFPLLAPSAASNAAATVAPSVASVEAMSGANPVVPPVLEVVPVPPPEPPEPIASAFVPHPAFSRV